jgi:hypothetical protein
MLKARLGMASIARWSGGREDLSRPPDAAKYEAVQ